MNAVTIKPGILYLCATPIGNLEDMTFRAVRILREVALVAAEDTRHTRKLFSHYDIHTALTSYHEHNKVGRGPELIGRLLAGDDIAVVSDAGLPGISDPGSDLVKLAITAGITVSPIPGPSAALAGLVASGLDTEKFLFVGFLPKTAKKRREMLGALAKIEYTLVFYESPYRIVSVLEEMSTIFGDDRPATAGREMTKKFEEFVRGTVETLKSYFSQSTPRGEFTLIVAGVKTEAKPDSDTAVDPAAQVMTLIAKGVLKKDAIKMVAQQLALPKREVYQAVLNLPDESG